MSTQRADVERIRSRFAGSGLNAHAFGRLVAPEYDVHPEYIGHIARGTKK